MLARALAVVAALAAFAPGVASATTLDMQFYNGHTYYLVSTNTRDGAEAEAVSLGGHLATVSDAAENGFIYNAFAVNRSEHANLWIGNLGGPGFFWEDGSAPGGYFPWAGGEPSGIESAVAIVTPLNPSGGLWFDLPQGQTNSFGATMLGVVEVNGIVPEPATLGLLALGAGAAALRRRTRRRA